MLNKFGEQILVQIKNNKREIKCLMKLKIAKFNKINLKIHKSQKKR